MTIDLTQTNIGAIQEALRQARQHLGGPASGMVLTLVVVTDESAQYDVVRAANEAGREHPCRVLVVITRRPDGPSRLDAEIRVGETSPGETVVLRMYGPLGQHADSVIAPLLMPDTPVVTWWPGEPPAAPAQDPIGMLAQRRITDSANAADPRRSLAALAAAYSPGDTDMSWTRATNWRSVLAAVFDAPHGEPREATVRGERGNPTAMLISAWLAERLRIPAATEDSEGPGITGVTFATDSGDITVARSDGRLAVLRREGDPERKIALNRRDTPELLTEELRRLDPDEVYGEALARLAI